MSQKFWVQNKFVPKKLVSKQNFGTKNFLRSQKMWVKQNFGKKLSIKKVKACKKLGPKRLVKIASVTDAIFLIWTNLARTNVALTNVTVTVGIYRC